MVTIHALMCVACIENMMCMCDMTQHSDRIKVYLVSQYVLYVVNLA